MQVKANQATLFKQLPLAASEQKPADQWQSQQKNRGRIEHRQVKLYQARPEWQTAYAGIACFVVLRRWGYRQGEAYDKTHYYICSRRFTCARKIGRLIRDHWSIENSLHYVKDVHMNEDGNRIAHRQAAKNCSLIKNIVLNLVRFRGLGSLKAATDLYAHNIKELYTWILQPK